MNKQSHTTGLHSIQASRAPSARGKGDYGSRLSSQGRRDKKFDVSAGKMYTSASVKHLLVGRSNAPARAFGRGSLMKSEPKTSDGGTSSVTPSVFASQTQLERKDERFTQLSPFITVTGFRQKQPMERRHMATEPCEPLKFDPYRSTTKAGLEGPTSLHAPDKLESNAHKPL